MPKKVKTTQKQLSQVRGAKEMYRHKLKQKTMKT